jgi:hypothetical protein
VFLLHILVGVDVQSSRNQANSPRAPAGLTRVATPIMPNGHMRSCPGRAACYKSRSWGFAEGDVTRVGPDVESFDWDTGVDGIASVRARVNG